MKTTYRHLIKILSCSITIFSVLLCSLIVPARAAYQPVQLYYPKDYIQRIDYDGSNLHFTYDFETSQVLFNVKDWATGETIVRQEDVQLRDVCGTQPYIFRVFPLGYSFSPSSNKPFAAIDITDFKSGAIFDFTTDLEFNIQYNYSTYAAGTTSFYFLTSVYVCFYDIDGELISTSITSNIRKDVSLISALPEGYDQQVILDIDIPLEIPDKAVVMAPCFISYLYPPDGHADHRIDVLEGSCHHFKLQASKNMLVDQAESLDVIEDQLGDLNDKVDDMADEMISGSSSMQTDAERFQHDNASADNKMDSALDKLEDMPDVNLDDVDLTFDGLSSDDGFSVYSNFFLTLSKDSFWVSMMIIVCTFIWVSTLLYGKRG